MIFEHAKKFGGEQQKTMQCFCQGTISLIVAPWKFCILKTSLFTPEYWLLGQLFVLRTKNFSRETSADNSLSRNILLFRVPL